MADKNADLKALEDVKSFDPLVPSSGLSSTATLSTTSVAKEPSTVVSATRRTSSIPATDVDESANASPFACNHVDVVSVTRIAELLLRGLAVAAIANTKGNPFEDSRKVSAEILTKLVPFLEKTSLEPSKPLTKSTSSASLAQQPLQHPPSNGIPPSPATVSVMELLDQFAESKRNLFTKMSSVFSSEPSETFNPEKVESLMKHIIQNDTWPIQQREALARKLVRNVDRSCREHCEDVLDSKENLIVHKEKCPLRPMTCPNNGCHEIFCASSQPTHDAICPYKPLPCQQHCSQTIARKDMTTHCATVCPKKIVPCPFAHAGCTKTMFQEGLPTHIIENVSTHLDLVNIESGRHAAALVDFQKQQGNILALCQNTEAAVTALTATVQDLGRKLLELDTQHRQTKKSMESAMGELEKENKKLRKDLAEAEKEGNGARKELRNSLAEIQKIKEVLSRR